MPLFHRGPPRITYPDTIDVELPDDFVTDHDIQPKKYTVDRPQLERVWREQYVIEPSVGSNPNLLSVFPAKLNYLRYGGCHL